MVRRLPHAAFAALALWILAGGTALAETRLAVFDFELNDTSLEGEVGGVRADETRRLQIISAEARRILAETPGVVLVDLGPEADRIRAAAPLFRCNGCDAPIALQAGADLSVTGYVQKVSNLILNLNFVVRDARTGTQTRIGSVDIRTNSDEMWTRGVRWLVKNRLLDPPLAP